KTLFFFFQAEDGIRDFHVTGVQTCALPICPGRGVSISDDCPLTPSLEALLSIASGRRQRDAHPARQVPRGAERKTRWLEFKSMCIGTGESGSPRGGLMGSTTAAMHSPSRPTHRKPRQWRRR